MDPRNADNPVTDRRARMQHLRGTTAHPKHRGAASDPDKTGPPKLAPVIDPDFDAPEQPVAARKHEPVKKRGGYKMPPDPPIPVGAMSIPSFCIAHDLSPDMYFKMKREKWGPKTMKVGTRTLISIEAAADWRRQREAAAAQDSTAA